VSLIINLYGGPGTGKSQTAAEFFSLIKKIEKERKISSALVLEKAKMYAWLKVELSEKMQNFLYFSQLGEEQSLNGAVDMIITDCATSICCFYQYYYSNETSLLAYESVKRQQSINLDFWCPRLKPYNPAGRYQTAEEAIEVDVALKNFLKNTMKLNLIELHTKELSTEIMDYLIQNKIISKEEGVTNAAI